MNPENTPKTDLLKNNGGFSRERNGKKQTRGNKRYGKSTNHNNSYKKFHGNRPFKDKLKRHK
ncbi:hypothetical protein JCM15457_825 [Liquorilactobacillus sucicola DSM 21376 = JCM 15457]|nr:hypothetical protein JCM15457_825 [Liquorilactobacillus sucicola DSM 21376 = JCM 15457]